MKNEEGSVLIISFIIILILLVIIGGMAMLINNELHIAKYEENNAKAFYIAEAGVEYALTVIDDDSMWDAEGNLKADSRANISDLFGGVLTTLTRVVGDDDKTTIESTGTVNEVVSNLEIEISKESTSVEFDNAIYSDNDITMSGSASISGDVFLNDGNMILSGNPAIDGDVFLNPDYDTDELKSYLDHYNFTGDVYNKDGKNFALPDFPEFPAEPDDITDKSNLYYNWDHKSNTIVDSGHYQEINVSNYGYDLDININNEDIVLIADDSFTASGDVYINREGSGNLYIFTDGSFNFSKNIYISDGIGDINIIAENFTSGGNGHINIDYSEDNGKVRFYIANQFSLSGSSTVNLIGNSWNIDPDAQHPEGVIMYYKGSSAITSGGSTRFVGSLYAETADINITGSGGITGHIITGGDNVSISGDASADVRALLAPNAAVTMTGSGKLKGAVVCEEISLSGSASIEYVENVGNDFPDMGSGDGETKIIWKK